MKIISHLIILAGFIFFLSCNNREEVASVPKIEATITTVSSEPIELNCTNLTGDWKISSVILSNQTSLSAQRLIKMGYCGYQYRLDVNSCGGGIEIFGKDSIRFGNVNCTEKCCDTKYSEMEIGYLTMMEKVTKFTKDSLILEATLKQPIILNNLKQDTLIGKTQVVLVKQ